MKTLQRKITLLQKKLDKQIQQEKKEKFCLVCGGKAEVRHHYIQKTKSAYLRYRDENLIPLCSHCHTLHHQSGDPEIVAIIVEKKGKKWRKWIEDHRRILIKRNKVYYLSLKKLLIKIL